MSEIVRRIKENQERMPDRASLKALAAICDVDIMPWQLAMFPKFTPPATSNKETK